MARYPLLRKYLAHSSGLKWLNALGVDISEFFEVDKG